MNFLQYGAECSLITRTAQSLTMPTDEGDDQFETIQQEFQVSFISF